MHRITSRRRVYAILAALGCAALSLSAPAASSAASRSDAAASVQPRASGELDCNGLSPIQKPVKRAVMCADPRGSDEGRTYENGHYIGHDEPSVRFVSKKPASGNDVRYTERLPVDPAAAPTTGSPGSDVTHWFELSVAPWMSITVCDPDSAPLTSCTPESDSNAPSGNYPGGGAGFVELQFYPPGFAPFLDSISCDNTHWCSALNIDSLECTGDGSGPCNNNCLEPVNFAFVQDNGVPTGPPSPQLSDNATFTPDANTLLMNPGDRITIHMFDAKVPQGHALEVVERDLTTGTSGSMIASAANGFMNTNPFDCSGAPFNFEPEYSTARAQNIIPWGIGPYMINNQFEIGHFEPCTTITGPRTLTSESFTDTYYKRCHGPYEAGDHDSGATFEPNDSPCYPAGDTHGGTTDPNLVTGCDVFFDAIGDLDYDGNSYRADWPNSLSPGAFPSPFLQRPPTTGGAGYGKIQFVTDTSATELNTDCDLGTGAGCPLPPEGPGNFYPYWTLAKVGGNCVWEFGNMTNGKTFGGDAQYGSVGPGTLGAFASAIRPSPTC
jgi:hypothetical protein